MDSSEHVLLIGASVRAAAGSALRAGLRPWCVDLFADADLAAACPARRLPGKYPHGFIAAAAAAPAGPWLYTGGLENWPTLVGRLARARPLWGNGPQVLRAVRRPDNVPQLLKERGLPCPGLHAPHAMVPRSDCWLRKPR